MIHIKAVCMVLLFCWMTAAKAQPAKKTVFIILDGIPADVIEKAATPHLDQIARIGGYRRASMGGEKGTYSQTPTISAVGYNSLLTGTWANKHNVWNNTIEAPNYHYWTIFRFLEEQYREKKTAIFSTWQDNRTKLVGEGLQQTGNIAIDYHFDGFELDTLLFPHDPDKKYISLIDQHVVKEASRYIKTEGPDLTWVYLEYTDDIGHTFGDSPNLYDAVSLADRQVGQIWQAIQDRQRQEKEDWLIIVTTDHGRDPQTGKNHGGQSDRERTIWITTNAPDLNHYFHHYQPSMVDIMPTIARFMDIQIPAAQAWELDGVPLIGQLSLAHPKATYANKRIHLSWKAFEKEGKVKVWLSQNNLFKQKGEADAYILVGEVPVSHEQYTIDLKQPIAPFYKIVIEGTHNSINRWVEKDKP